MKSILVIGVGKFGHHLVNKLLELDNEVMIIDSNEDHIRDMFTKVNSARVGDCTNVEVLKSLGIRNFDVIIVCIAEDFQNSLEVTNLVKRAGRQTCYQYGKPRYSGEVPVEKRCGRGTVSGT